MSSRGWCRAGRSSPAEDLVLQGSLMTTSESVLSAAARKDLYRQMARIRKFEEKTHELYKAGRLTGMSPHLCIGEEASAVGVISALLPDDYILSTHRGHGHCLAKGAEMGRMYAELF